jgi:hypothetical protein
MTDVPKMKARVEAEIKRIDSAAITGTFYDTASDRLFVTIVKGSRKVSVALRARDFANGDGDKVNRAIKDGIRRLEVTPIG